MGPTFYDLFANFPDVEWVYMVNLEYVPLMSLFQCLFFLADGPRRDDSGAVANAVTEAQHAVDALGDQLIAIEIGNEPNFYPGSNRPISYNMTDYLAEWTTRAQAISEQVLQKASWKLSRKRFFQALVVVSVDNDNYTFSAGDWQPLTALDDGLATNPYMETLCVHKYGSVSKMGGTLESLVLNASFTEALCSDYAEDIAFLERYRPGTPFIMGEGQMFLEPGYAEIGNVLGYALGTANWLLWSASMNVSRNYMFTSSTHNYSIAHPRSDSLGPAAVQASYYGFLFWADFLGTANDVRIAQLSLAGIPAADAPFVRAYGAYHDGVLAKIAILNMVAHNATATTTAAAAAAIFGPRPSTTFSIALPYMRTSNTFKVEQLTGPGSNVLDGITWAGFEYSYATGGHARFVRDTTFRIHSFRDQLEITVDAASAVLITL